MRHPVVRLFCLFVYYFCLYYSGKSTVLRNPTSFCLDEVGNIIVADSATNSFKFFSPEGDLFHKIGEDTVGSDEVKGVYDIVTYNGNVIVSCNDGSIRIY